MDTLSAGRRTSARVKMQATKAPTLPKGGSKKREANKMAPPAKKMKIQKCDETEQIGEVIGKGVEVLAADDSTAHAKVIETLRSFNKCYLHLIQVVGDSSFIPLVFSVRWLMYIVVPGYVNAFVVMLCVVCKFCLRSRLSFVYMLVKCFLLEEEE